MPMGMLLGCYHRRLDNMRTGVYFEKVYFQKMLHAAKVTASSADHFVYVFILSAILGA